MQEGMDCVASEHGDGMYRVEYDGEVIASGGTFYDSESVDLGCVTEAEAPTMRPTKKKKAFWRRMAVAVSW
eukprot:CAMPEP_0201876424 /NCGR_PEP_ID=MMETSP0902-20130614/8121_1 /ASSEMBLY_ACC=CAM_ASM_000551 /TAXON_ID=420261 /ORGANISM="Thalassiosira antarctica, Strain CCMP982" /LENGTH=70 /DNA_ID=CAMNT_0048403671 /DNA_START=562 /DNA_END=771 /DNA_ORIENTATION=+